ncbi:hypothetical protein [Lyngbya confervoides]|uniref:Uncharacterized protein n=1 Tax=Lyngbya confervoides BDU141951 TaxID=1574623 RepID=A0ABD4T025_9CYAN|nr:hypothetical protein [Lyngbya confervoides]MCM1981878.1 hypothetical protein [Lyngbya confervoides BDU141951]
MDPSSPPLHSSPPSFQSISEAVHQAASEAQGDLAELLKLLRLLEKLHREIRDDAFLRLLPTNRQALYALLRDIEQEGGWPYIPRMKLRKLLEGEEGVQAESLPFADADP